MKKLSSNDTTGVYYDLVQVDYEMTPSMPQPC